HQGAVGHLHVFRDQGVGADQAPLADAGAVKDHRVHADQAAVADGAAMEHHFVAHHHLPANDTGHALVHVDHRALLDVGIVADHHPVVVGADHHIEPDAHPPPDLDGPDHGGAGGDVVFTEHCHGAVTKAVQHGLSLRSGCRARLPVPSILV